MLTNKDLQTKAISIKGKSYILVADRVLFFNENYKNGSIESKLVSPVDSQTIIVKAVVTPDVTNPSRRFVAYSQAVIGQGMVNTTSALENAETSAIGRALGFMGIGVIESIASADEMVKAENATPKLGYVEGKTCPKDGGRLILNVSKTGKKFHRCENAKWDNENKKNVGCDYIDWLNIPVTWDKKDPYKDKSKTISVEEYENYTG